MQNEIVKYSKEWEKTYNDEAKKIKKHSVKIAFPFIIYVILHSKVMYAK